MNFYQLLNEVTENDFINTLQQDPNMSNWLAFADWLEEQGDSKGEMIRIAIAIADSPLTNQHIHPRFDKILKEIPRNNVFWVKIWNFFNSYNIFINSIYNIYHNGLSIIRLNGNKFLELYKNTFRIFQFLAKDKLEKFLIENKHMLTTAAKNYLKNLIKQL